MNKYLLEFLLASAIIIVLIAWAKIFVNRYFKIILIGLIVRLFIIFIHEKTRLFGDLDIGDYLRYFEDFNDLWNKDLLNYIRPHVPAYTILYPGWIFNVLGEPGLWVIRVVNASLGVAIVAPLGWINQITFGTRLRQSQALLIVLWPSWIRYTVEVGRAAPSVFFVVLGISGFMTIINHPKLSKKLSANFSAVIGIFFAVFLRIHYLAYFIPLAALAFISQVRKSKTSPQIKLILYFISLLITVGVTIFLIITYKQLSQYGNTGSVFDSPEDALAYAERREEGNSAYLRGIYPRNLLDLIWYLPLQAFYFIFSPMLWDANTPFAMGSAIQATFMFTLCFRAWRKLEKQKILKNNQSLKLVLVSILFASVAFGSVTKNAGGAERWRFPSTLILLTTTTTIIMATEQKQIDDKKIINLNASIQ